ncbi:MAG TPA: methyltransferase domain-containing protein [Cryptosporangiaceae bacterium]|nr:methyltransferase domain-containing protein [Cryptosporangiaceae bacterium]
MGTRGHRLFAAGYDRMNAPAEREFLGPRRERLLGELTGQVLDVGAGTGANLRYLRRADRVVAAEPDPAMRRRLEKAATEAPVPVEVDDAAAEMLPYPDHEFDAVVFSLVLCTVADPARALAEARRVLRPDGRLLVLEHVRGDGRLARWQDLVTPLWRRMVAGCHPGRDTRAAVVRAGFAFVEVEEFQPMPRWIPVSPWLCGVAEPVRR